MRDDALALKQEEEADSLQNGDRDGKQATPADELRTAALAFFKVRLLHLRKDDGTELHDDRGGDVGSYSEHHDREIRKPAAGEDIQKSEKLITREERGERILVDAWDRHRCEQAEERERSREEEDAETDLWIAKHNLKLKDERIKHGWFDSPRFRSG